MIKRFPFHHSPERGRAVKEGVYMATDHETPRLQLALHFVLSYPDTIDMLARPSVPLTRFYKIDEDIDYAEVSRKIWDKYDGDLRVFHLALPSLDQAADLILVEKAPYGSVLAHVFTVVFEPGFDVHMNNSIRHKLHVIEEMSAEGEASDELCSQSESVILRHGELIKDPDFTYFFPS